MCNAYKTQLKPGIACVCSGLGLRVVCGYTISKGNSCNMTAGRGKKKSVSTNRNGLFTDILTDELNYLVLSYYTIFNRVHNQAGH